MTPLSDEREIELPLAGQEAPLSGEMTDTLDAVRERETYRAKQFRLGSKLLYVCIALMAGCIGLSLWEPEGELLDKGFDAFRLIVMTVLGYLFGTNTTTAEKEE